MFMVSVNADTCDGCEECVTICPNEVLQMTDGKATVDGGGECENCESCLDVCPSGSITITEM
jgi:NAD-dependent dihydropyrimidine dehydrogenase PreA subunit